jgi:radical SAM superfamily enzyme YgiQ (UPF0313 family)
LPYKIYYQIIIIFAIAVAPCYSMLLFFVITNQRKRWPMPDATEKKIRLCRFIRPANPPGRVNVFSQFTKWTTTFGLMMVATIVSRLKGWNVEVIDEENYRGKRSKDGLPDHEVLQRDDPADVVGFYCGLTSTIERVWELAAFYKAQGVTTLAGSWHAHNCPEETLRHNIDLVVHGEAEKVIELVLANLEKELPLYEGVGGVSYLDRDKPRHVLPSLEDPGQISDYDFEKLVPLENKLTHGELNLLPYPDFGLLVDARIKIYPIGRIRGCSMKCSFCSVKAEPHWACAKWLFGLVDHLVKTRQAKNFFLVDDRSEEDLQGTVEFFEMVAEKYGKRLGFTVQMRLPAAKKVSLLETMREAGVRVVCIGLESPIDEELRAMKKGLTAKAMVDLIRVWRRYMKVHGMFIFGFPAPGFEKTVAERVRIFKRFIRKARLDFVQVVLPIPLPGTELYNECKAAGRIFPLSVAPWSMYDGNFLLIKPDGDVNVREIQSAHTKIMKWFYGPVSFYKMVYRTLIFPLDYLSRGWEPWHSDWAREVIRWIGHGVVGRWLKAKEDKAHVKKLQEYLKK